MRLSVIELRYLDAPSIDLSRETAARVRRNPGIQRIPRRGRPIEIPGKAR
jgi:hypothetical protein